MGTSSLCRSVPAFGPSGRTCVDNAPRSGYATRVAPGKIQGVSGRYPFRGRGRGDTKRSDVSVNPVIRTRRVHGRERAATHCSTGPGWTASSADASTRKTHLQATVRLSVARATSALTDRLTRADGCGIPPAQALRPGLPWPDGWLRLTGGSGGWGLGGFVVAGPLFFWGLVCLRRKPTPRVRPQAAWACQDACCAA